jgi:hypothetical protein
LERTKSHTGLLLGLTARRRSVPKREIGAVFVKEADVLLFESNQLQIIESDHRFEQIATRAKKAG